jgi:L-rhamnose mutarotase
MKNIIISVRTVVLISTISLLSGCNPKQAKVSDQTGAIVSTTEMVTGNPNQKNTRRIGMVTKIRPERLNEYLALHADTNPGVRDLLKKYNMRNFSIYMVQLEDGNYYEFGYYEYWGNDLEGDMAKLAEEPRNKAWLKICDPMQIPLKGNTSWKEMKMIFLNY